jgi:hypothetical protein
MRLSSHIGGNVAEPSAISPGSQRPTSGPKIHQEALGRRALWLGDGRVTRPLPPLPPLASLDVPAAKLLPAESAPVCLAYIGATQEYLYVERTRQADNHFNYVAYLGKRHHMRPLTVQSSTVMPVPDSGHTTMVTHLITEEGTVRCGLPCSPSAPRAAVGPRTLAHRCEIAFQGQPILQGVSYASTYLQQMRESLLQALGIPRMHSLRGRCQAFLRPLVTACRALMVPEHTKAGHGAADGQSGVAMAAVGVADDIQLFDQVVVTNHERRFLCPKRHLLRKVHAVNGIYMVVGLQRARYILVDSRGEHFAIDRQHAPLRIQRAPWRDAATMPATAPATVGQGATGDVSGGGP